MCSSTEKLLRFRVVWSSLHGASRQGRKSYSIYQPMKKPTPTLCKARSHTDGRGAARTWCVFFVMLISSSGVCCNDKVNNKSHTKNYYVQITHGIPPSSQLSCSCIIISYFSSVSCSLLSQHVLFPHLILPLLFSSVISISTWSWSLTRLG